jgi:hypothetical protein
MSPAHLPLASKIPERLRRALYMAISFASLLLALTVLFLVRWICCQCDSDTIEMGALDLLLAGALAAPGALWGERFCFGKQGVRAYYRQKPNAIEGKHDR